MRDAVLPHAVIVLTYARGLCSAFVAGQLMPTVGAKWIFMWEEMMAPELQWISTINWHIWAGYNAQLITLLKLHQIQLKPPGQTSQQSLVSVDAHAVSHCAHVCVCVCYCFGPFCAYWSMTWWQMVFVVNSITATHTCSKQPVWESHKASMVLEFGMVDFEAGSESRVKLSQGGRSSTFQNSIILPKANWSSLVKPIGSSSYNDSIYWLTNYPCLGSLYQKCSFLP